MLWVEFNQKARTFCKKWIVKYLKSVGHCVHASVCQLNVAQKGPCVPNQWAVC